VIKSSDEQRGFTLTAVAKLLRRSSRQEKAYAYCWKKMPCARSWYCMWPQNAYYRTVPGLEGC